MAYRIEFDPDAESELLGLRAYDRNIILDAIEDQLEHEPTQETRRKGALSLVRVSWEHSGPIYRLRVGDFRVYYQVVDEGALVTIKAVRKKGTKTTDEIV